MKTSLFKAVRDWLIIVGFIVVLNALTSCGNAPPVPPKAIPAPRQSVAVTPLVDRVRADAAKSGEVSAKLEGKVDDLQRTTGELRAGMSAATAEADRLRKQKAATEQELDGLWQLLTASDEHAKRLFAEVGEAKSAAEAQRQQRQLSEVRLNELAQAAIARDTETLELRDQRDHLATELNHATTVTIPKLSDQLRKAEMRAAVGQYLKGIVWVIGIVIFLIVAVKAVSFFKPL